MKAILGIKKNMTHVYDEKGKSIPVTVIDTKDCVIAGVRLADTHGYSALQLGLKKARKPSNPLKGVYKDIAFVPKFVKEIRNATLAEGQDVGSDVSADVFSQGDIVDVSSISKGKGFSGVVKRWHFHGGPKTHGQSNKHRSPGSIGAGTTPGRVVKGKHMAGRMGGEQVTVKNLKVMFVDAENGVLAVHGSIPGANGSLLVIKQK